MRMKWTSVRWCGNILRHAPLQTLLLINLSTLCFESNLVQPPEKHSAISGAWLCFEGSGLLLSQSAARLRCKNTSSQSSTLASSYTPRTGRSGTVLKTTATTTWLSSTDQVDLSCKSFAWLCLCEYGPSRSCLVVPPSQHLRRATANTTAAKSSCSLTHLPEEGWGRCVSWMCYYYLKLFDRTVGSTSDLFFAMQQKVTNVIFPGIILLSLTILNQEFHICMFMTAIHFFFFTLKLFFLLYFNANEPFKVSSCCHEDTDPSDILSVLLSKVRSIWNFNTT